MVKLDVTMLRYLTVEDFRVITAVCYVYFIKKFLKNKSNFLRFLNNLIINYNNYCITTY